MLLKMLFSVCACLWVFVYVPVVFWDTAVQWGSIGGSGVLLHWSLGDVFASEKWRLASVVLWFLLLLVLPQQDPTLNHCAPLYSPPPPHKAWWEALACSSHPSPWSCIVSPVIIADITLSPVHTHPLPCTMMSLHVKQGISMRREILPAFPPPP